MYKMYIDATKMPLKCLHSITVLIQSWHFASWHVLQFISNDSMQVAEQIVVEVAAALHE